MEQDSSSRTTLVHAITPKAHTATVTGAAIDTFGYESLTWSIHVGEGLLGGVFVISVESSPDDGSGSPTGTWTALTATDLLDDIPVLALFDEDLMLRVGIASTVRHQRIVLTESGTVIGGTIGVSGILGHPRVTPTAAQST